MATTRRKQGVPPPDVSAFEEAKKRWIARRQAGPKKPKAAQPPSSSLQSSTSARKPSVTNSPTATPSATPPVRYKHPVGPRPVASEAQLSKTTAMPPMEPVPAKPDLGTPIGSSAVADEKAAWALVAKGGSVGALGYLKLKNMALRDGNTKYVLEYDKKAKNLLRAEAGLPALSKGGSVHGKPMGTPSMEEHMKFMQKQEEQARAKARKARRG